MDKETRESLRRVIEYLEAEEDHYFDNDSPTDHIYLDVDVLTLWLEREERWENKRLV